MQKNVCTFSLFDLAICGQNFTENYYWYGEHSAENEKFTIIWILNDISWKQLVNFMELLQKNHNGKLLKFPHRGE